MTDSRPTTVEAVKFAIIEADGEWVKETFSTGSEREVGKWYATMTREHRLARAATLAAFGSAMEDMDARLAIAKAEFERGFPGKDCSTINSTLAYGRIQGFENARAMIEQAIKEIDHG